MDTKFRNFIEIGGIAGVIASLVFVGMQLLLDRRVATADQYALRAELRLASLQSWLESDAYLANRERQWEQGERPVWWHPELEQYYRSSGMSGVDVTVEMLATEMDLITFDNVFFQYQQGLITEDFWLAIRARFQDRLRDQWYRELHLNMNTLLPVQQELQTMVAEL